MTPSFKYTKRVLASVLGLTSGVLAASAVRPQVAEATECIEPEATSMIVVAHDVPAADRIFWETHTIDAYSSTFWLIESANDARIGYFETAWLGDLSSGDEP